MMKKILNNKRVKIGLFSSLGLLLAVGLFFILTSRSAIQEEDYCTKVGTGEKMSLTKAREIAESSECVGEGVLKEEHFCNENTGTWWITLEIEKEGCYPACVVDVVTKQAEINWRCTGLVPR